MYNVVMSFMAVALGCLGTTSFLFVYLGDIAFLNFAAVVIVLVPTLACVALADAFSFGTRNKVVLVLLGALSAPFAVFALFAIATRRPESVINLLAAVLGVT